MLNIGDIIRAGTLGIIQNMFGTYFDAVPPNDLVECYQDIGCYALTNINMWVASDLDVIDTSMDDFGCYHYTTTESVNGAN